MTVGTKQKLAYQNEELFLTINSEQLQHSTCEKLFGIKIDSKILKGRSFIYKINNNGPSIEP
jgi:stress-induced morphogen